VAYFKHCFIVTYGRSGSTLLQAMLNSLPGYVIRGENGGLVEFARLLVRRLDRVRASSNPPSSSPSDAWYGLAAIDRTGLLRGLGEVLEREVIRPPADARCVGFKEIRYGPQDTPDLGDLLNFMSEVFERSCFIFNARRLEDVAKSQWWANRPDSLQYLQSCEERMRTAHASGAYQSYWVDYDSYSSHPEELSGLFEFLGEPFDLQAVRDVLAVRQNPSPRDGTSDPRRADKLA